MGKQIALSTPQKAAQQGEDKLLIHTAPLMNLWYTDKWKNPDSKVYTQNDYEIAKV